MNEKVAVMYQEYCKRLNADWNKDGSYSPTLLYRNAKEIVLFEQVEYIKQYLGHMIIDGDTEDNLNRIKHFLSMQGAINHQNRMEIRFLGIEYNEVFCFIDELNDIDLADSWGICYYEKIHVYLGNDEEWTDKSVKDFIKEVKYDLGFDFINYSLDFEVRGRLLEIECEID